MTSFVYDFKDIASRMKGELKAAPEAIIICVICDGVGKWHIGDYHNTPIFQHCDVCDGTGRANS